MIKLPLLLIPLMALSTAHAFTFSSPDFKNNSTMPVLHTCDGKDISPQLQWSDPPPQTKSFALLVADPDAPSGTFYHWVVFDIPANVTEFARGDSKGTTATNSFGNTQYNGPCPPPGKVHHYIFTLYALDSFIDLPAEADAPTVLAALKSHILNKAQLTATYKRG